MKIGVPKEIKVHEYRVGLVPAGVRELVDAGHEVLVQTGAGAGIGFEDSHYQAAGVQDRRHARRYIYVLRPRREGQGASARRVPATEQGTGPVHLSPPCRGPRADRCLARLERDRHRLRNRYGTRRVAAPC